MQISGILIQTRPEWREQLGESLAAQPWLDVHYTDGHSRIIVTLENLETESGEKRLRRLQDWPHVLSVNLINHYQVDENQFEEAKTDNIAIQEEVE
ncbi:MAG: chaperone NapD [Nitrospinaceae bacterium]|jgi:nitrate reductase NapAB chaperone NapD|nr:hypothetical protein [Magnetovibrio sp.]MDP6735013.1 chaperone NapD [Nitrospinaceae bacterium]